MRTPSLQHEIGKQRPFDLPEEEAHLNLVRSAALLTAEFERRFKPYGISGAGYNVLRILRGHALNERAAHRDRPGGVPSQTIGREMVTPVPDITRLVDRLEARGLVRRVRPDHDRRIVLVCITSEGLDLLASLDKPLANLHRDLLAHMTPTELAQLNTLLIKARCPDGARPRPRTPRPRSKKGTP